MIKIRFGFSSIQIKLFTGIVSLFLLNCCSEKSVTPVDYWDGPLELVWSDEFNTDGNPDPEKWNFEYGFIRNNEDQWYQPENAFCSNGLLIVEGRKERVPNPNYNPESSNWQENREYAEYTSSSLTTKDLHSWKFGRFEMRARIDTRAGLWPAFWTKGIEYIWPHCGEVDIMEYSTGILAAKFAWGDEEVGQPIWDYSFHPVSELGDSNWTNDFHIWRMDWDDKQMSIYLDDILLNSVDLSQTYNRDELQQNPFMQEHYIILNLAIGGTLGGNPDNTSFPARFEVDYVRIYQKK